MARNIKLVDADGVDATDVRSLVATATAGCGTDQEKMIALWGYITRSGFYHWCEARENPEGATELGLVLDPVVAFNVYGTVICYQVVDILANLADQAGMRGRTRGVPGHRVTEVFYDGGWHLFDAQHDCAAYYVADDGKTVIDLAELCRDAAKYIREPKFPSRPFYQFDRHGGRFWPWESKEHVIKRFYHPGVPKRADVYAPYVARGHTIHLDLRRGEKLIRNFTNEGKWYCPPDFHARWKRDSTQRWVDDGPHDPRNPANTYANGELVYEPDWAASEDNFLDGLYDGANYVLKAGAVHPRPGAAAQVTFRVQSPYLIAGKPGKLDVAGDSRDGAIFEAEFFRADAEASNRVAVSTDNGTSWQEVWENDRTGRRAVRLDLTGPVEGKYGYLVRISLSGRRSQDAAVAKLKLRTSLFLSPIPLPAVGPGRNRFAFAVDAGHGVLRIRPDLGDAAAWKRSFHEIKDLSYNPRFTNHLSPLKREGHAIVEVAPPPGAKVAWLTVHASLGTRGPDEHESAEILYATGPAGPWRSAWKSDFSPRNDKWRWDCSVDCRLKTPARKCYVKVLLRRRRHMSLNLLRINAHYVRPARLLKPGGVAVTHSWLADGKPATRTVRPDPAGETYTIVAKGKRIENRSVVIEVANEGSQRSR